MQQRLKLAGWDAEYDDAEEEKPSDDDEGCRPASISPPDEGADASTEGTTAVMTLGWAFEYVPHALGNVELEWGFVEA
ncbi:hypothetical protein CYMTET_32225 [Cymbomonas tetramitiformis]|uniref:Uncharacterized protein n=1 Tax=Cymbomonas tetramitiformis TaxID=36881 RepID=A0AAE0FFF5_9CHLO|nr:hypothetical protein CYMTET_32225 [Cymbomonas tetramitiformis]